jgi:uncharacterized protein
VPAAAPQAASELTGFDLLVVLFICLIFLFFAFRLLWDRGGGGWVITGGSSYSGRDHSDGFSSGGSSFSGGGGSFGGGGASGQW